MTAQNLKPSFTLVSLQLKPMVAPEPRGTTVWIKGYRGGGDEPLFWDVYFPSGYHLPLLVDLEKFSKEKWEKLHKVEIAADFGYDALDWEFCVDDIRIQYTSGSEPGRGSEAVDQKVLNMDL